MKSFMMITRPFLLFLLYTGLQIIRANNINNNPQSQQHQVAQYNRQLVHPSNVGFREIDDLDRISVLQFTLETLVKTAAENDLLKRRQGNKLAYNDKLFHDDEDEDTDQLLSPTLQQFFDKLSSVSFKVRNLTIIIALVYMDKVAQILNLFADGRTVRRLFGGCLIIASKMHRNEVSREELAECMDLSIRELVNIESAIVMSVKDLTVHPQVLINYLTPLMGSKASAKLFSPSDRNTYNYYQ
jgi:hypothetical protein